MSQEAYQVRATRPGTTNHYIKAVGGSAAVTKVSGQGVAVSRTSTGLYLLTWAENPGVFLMPFAQLQATTHADLDGWSVVFGVYNSSAWTLAFSVYNDTPTITDLAALNWVNLNIVFKDNSA
jgi:hypothetical protein